jgi:hypothetical protein
LTHAEFWLGILKPWWAMRLWCMSNDDNMIHLESSSVKRRSQPMEEHRPKTPTVLSLELRGLSKSCIDATMHAARGEAFMEEQIDSRLCFVCGIRSPIGLNLGGRTPAETALSILAEIGAVKNGHSGGSLRDTKGRIGG